MSKADYLSELQQKKLMLHQYVITVTSAVLLRKSVCMCCNTSELLGPAALSGFIKLSGFREMEVGLREAALWTGLNLKQESHKVRATLSHFVLHCNTKCVGLITTVIVFCSESLRIIQDTV